MEHERLAAASRGEAMTSLHRRRLLLAGTGVLVGGLSGCLGGESGGSTDDSDGTTGDSEGDAPAAITVPEGATCEVCGMTIRQQPGPTTEIFYANEEPEGHENPARFDSTWEAYQYEFDRDDEGWEDVAFYVTDYSAVEYELFEDGGDTLISKHYEASAFVPATEVTFVVDSDVKGAMGRDLIGFSERADAESFQSEFGGSLTDHEGVTPEVVAGLGM
ncbi:nitrous oxide reductase accessory protein NosL [Halobellus captivus]|uniref:nitrous oxide reductase accessory protein NosL n=1 Tax=Halobellus captivus TaxID=2592614 RepID=UPI001EF07373|nr:nitrous oxide reductase accessory protein NosL [Halobellus captivus]